MLRVMCNQLIRIVKKVMIKIMMMMVVVVHAGVFDGGMSLKEYS